MTVRFCIAVMLLFGYSTVCANLAHAYIDMGTGSYVIQMAFAGLLSVGVALRIFWGRIKSFFSRNDNEDK